MSYNIKTNNTTLFLVPPLGISVGAKREHGFVGAYLGDVNRPEIEYERGIFMLFKPPNLAMFSEWLDEEKERNPNLVEDYDYDGGYVVVIYVLEEKFADDYQKFLEGKYSKFSKEFKNKFPQTVTLRDYMGKSSQEVSLQWRIFKKDPVMRQHWEEELDVRFDKDWEVWSSPTLEEGKNGEPSPEKLDIEKIKSRKYENSG